MNQSVRTVDEQPAGAERFRPPAPRIVPFKGHRHLMLEREPVVVTELVEGVEARLGFSRGRLRGVVAHGSAPVCQTVQDFGLPNVRSLQVCRTLQEHRWVEEFCLQNPDHVVYAVIYSAARYGRGGLVVHDILRPDGQWTRWHEIDRRGVFADARRWAPVLHFGPYDEAEVLQMLDGRSTLPEAIGPRAGVVIAPLRADVRARLAVHTAEV